MQTGAFQGFSRFRYVRLRKRRDLKSRIIDSLAVLWAARRRQAPASAISQLRQVVRYSIRLRCNKAALHDWTGAGSAIGSSNRARMAGLSHQAVANGLTGRLAGF